MELDKIGGMTQGDLRRFIVNLMHSDPGALPKKAPNTAQQFPSSPVDGDVPVWDRASQAWVPSTAHPVDGTAFNWHVGTSPPSGPTTGMLWIYTGTGFYWLFVYDNSETTYKWKFVGGAPTAAVIATQESTASASYVDLATAGPSVTAPRAGDYEIVYGATQFTGAGSICATTIKVGSAAASDTDATRFTSAAANAQATVYMTRVVNAAASDALKMQYKMFGGGTGTWYERAMYVRPIRVS